MIYLWECTNCKHQQETEQSLKEDIKNPLDCDNCHYKNLRRVYEMPGVTRKSFLDGARKDRDWVEMKQAAKLEVQKAQSTDPEERVALGKDIKRLRTPRK